MSKSFKVTSASENKEKATSNSRIEELEKKLEELLDHQKSAKQELLNYLTNVGTHPFTSQYVLGLEGEIIKSSHLKKIRELKKLLETQKPSAENEAPKRKLFGRKDSENKAASSRQVALNEWCRNVFFKKPNETPLAKLLYDESIFSSKNEARDQFIRDVRVITLEFICKKLECSVEELRDVFDEKYRHEFKIQDNAIIQYKQAMAAPAKSIIQTILEANDVLNETMWKELEEFASREKLAFSNARSSNLSGFEFPFLKRFEEDQFPTIKDLLDLQFFGKNTPMDLLLKDKGKSAQNNPKTVLNMRAAVLEYLYERFKFEPKAMQIAYNYAGGGVIEDDVVEECQKRIEKRKLGELSFDSNEETKTPPTPRTPHRESRASGSGLGSGSPVTPTSSRTRGSSASPLSTGSAGKSNGSKN